MITLKKNVSSYSIYFVLLELHFNIFLVTWQGSGSFFIVIAGYVEVSFFVSGLHWQQKEHKIRNLASRYEEIWNSVPL
jgi:hypothetical protein